MEIKKIGLFRKRGSETSVILRNCLMIWQIFHDVSAISITVCCRTCAMRIPVTIASWCSVPSAPLRLVGAISPTYIGVKPDASPAERISWMTDRHFASCPKKMTKCETAKNSFK